MTKIIFFLLLLYIIININIGRSGRSHALSLPENVTVPAVFIFGDSIVDPGNSDLIFSACRADHPPYGRDFHGGKATGRFSNGRIPSDFLAEEFGVKELLPAYLDPSLKMEDLLTGVSFAFSCCGYDPLTPQIYGVPSLAEQLQHFKEWAQKVKAAVGEWRTSRIISDSVYVIVAGSNDFSATYYGTPLRRPKYTTSSSYADLLMDFASTFLQELHGLGARRIAAVGLPPQGCLPAMRTIAGGPSRACYEQFNQDSLQFNSKLQYLMHSLGNKLPRARFVYLDLYTPLLRIIENPLQFGFGIANKGCCGSGTFEVAGLCNSLDPFTCKDDSNYVFWDSFHTTDAACEIIVHEILSKSINDFF
ncbi:hypothetical protein Dimus_017373 [Dionaea muscipula]